MCFFTNVVLEILLFIHKIKIDINKILYFFGTFVDMKYGASDLKRTKNLGFDKIFYSIKMRPKCKKTP